MASPMKICVHAAIYVLDESLKKYAIDLKQFIKDEHEVEICKCPWDKICPDDEGSVAVACEHYFKCEKQENPIKSSHDQCEVDVYNFDDLSETIDKVKSGADIPYYEVIIILGHCSALLAGEDDLVVALRKINPIIVAFLGCCGGNTRYGPIAKMSQLLDPDDDKDIKPIIGFYQRRVYVSELLTTSLVIGLWWYMYFCSLEPVKNKATYRKIAICAFGLSTLRKLIFRDPTSFVNDTPEDSFVHKCRKECNFDLNINDIPLSCMQFALCNPMIMEQSLLKMEWSKLHAKIKESMCKRYTELVKQLVEKKMPKEPTKIKLDNLCKEKIRYHEFHKLIPLIHEINFIKLSNKTLDLLKKGDWKNIDHLQFLIAVLRGHWGTNSLDVITEWATFHLVEVMKRVMEDPSQVNKYKINQHQYKLCCMCFVLLSSAHFVRFVESDEKFGILACTIKLHKHRPWIVDGIIDITPETKIQSELPDVQNFLDDDKFLDDDELSWVDLYQHCQYNNHCVELLDPTNPRQSWSIGNRTAYGDMVSQYDYNKIDFKLAAGALSDYVKTDDIHRAIVNNINRAPANNVNPAAALRVCSETCRPVSYCCKDFTNENVGNYLRYIDEDNFQREFHCTRELSFVESRVIYWRNRHNITDDQQLIHCYQQHPATACFDEAQLRAAFDRMFNNWRSVLSCRFLFVQFNNPADDTRIEGILFYTDTHYGHNLIDFSDPQIHAIACIRCKRHMEQTQHHLINTIMKLCMVCKYRMQRKIIEQMTAEPPIRQIDFPFAKIGRLILSYGDDHRLTHIDLRDLP